MANAIKTSLVSLERGNMFLVGLGLVSVPTQKMISHVLDLCKTKPSRLAMLTLGTIIHKLCEKDPSQCMLEVRTFYLIYLCFQMVNLLKGPLISPVSLNSSLKNVILKLYFLKFFKNVFFFFSFQNL